MRLQHLYYFINKSHYETTKQNTPICGCFISIGELDRYSQHANILAVLTNIIPKNEQEVLVQRIMEDEELVQATYYFRFYLFRAMIEAGLANDYLNHLDPWYDALSLGMTTFPEHPEPSRSDAHAWSSSPNYDFFRLVAIPLDLSLTNGSPNRRGRLFIFKKRTNTCHLAYYESFLVRLKS